MDAALPLLPEPGPPGEVKVDHMDIRQRFLCQRSLNGLPVIRPGDNPHLMEPGDLFHPVPADARLRTLVRLTRIGRQQHFETLHVLPWVFLAGKKPPSLSAPLEPQPASGALGQIVEDDLFGLGRHLLKRP